jgi:hypothetical protein
MKKSILFFLLFAQTAVYAQQGFKWQGLAKDSLGNPVTQPVLLTFSILQNDTVVYSETHNNVIPVSGQLTATIGADTANLNAFAGIDWSGGVCSLNVKMQIGNEAIVDMGTSQILAVPIALYSENSGSISGQNLFKKDGNTGIGTNLPLAPLHIKTSDPDIILDFNNNPQASLSEIRFNNNGENRAGLQWNRTTNDVQLLFDNTVSGQGAFQIIGGGLPKMVISNSGRIGIGTILPASPLHIKTSDPDIILDFNNNPQASLSELRFNNNGENRAGLQFNRISNNIQLLFDNNVSGQGEFQVFSGGGLPKMVISNSGKVGIGTNSPNELLEVNGTAQVKILKITGGDVAEARHSTTEDILPTGSVVVFDENEQGKIRLSSKPYDKKVAGVISGAGNFFAGVCLLQEELSKGAMPVAQIGTVEVWAIGPIEVGDLLTTSKIPGHAMKAKRAKKCLGTVIGKAISTLPKGIKGLVEIQIEKH